MTAERRLPASIAPALVGLATSALTAWLWGWWNPPPIIHDEASYLLQARIFAGFRWTAAGRAFPRFFDQMQVFTTPILASKYPPGHALLLVPGIWMHWPVLVPLLLVGSTAALYFTLARAIEGPWFALLAWTLWVTSLGFRVYSTTYLSETTTAFLWALGWLALFRWREARSSRWLVLLACAVGWGALTRPFTAIAFAIPAGAVVLHDAVRERRWRPVALAALAGAVVLAIVPIWNHATLGRWFRTPYAEYSRIYFPYEKPGFGEDPTPPAAPLPFGKEGYDRQYRAIHRAHSLAGLPKTAAARTRRILEMISDGRSLLLVFFLAGIFVAGREIRFALAACALLVVVHLVMAHPAEWTVYYVETFPVLCLVAAAGLWKLFRWAIGYFEDRRGRAVPASRWLTILACSAIVLGALPGMAALRIARRRETAERHAIFEFARRARFRAILFLPCSESRQDLCDAVQNAPDLDRENVWLVHDLGPEDRKLIDAAHGRIPLRYDPVARRIVRITG